MWKYIACGRTSKVYKKKNMVKKIYNSPFVDLFDKEVKVLTQLRDFPHFPTIISSESSKHEKSIIMSDCGERLCKDNLPSDWKQQLKTIMKTLRRLGILHNDNNLKNFTVKESVLYQIDFGRIEHTYNFLHKQAYRNKKHLILAMIGNQIKNYSNWEYLTRESNYTIYKNGDKIAKMYDRNRRKNTDLFKNEITALIKVKNHPNFPTILSFDETDFVIVMTNCPISHKPINLDSCSSQVKHILQTLKQLKLFPSRSNLGFCIESDKTIATDLSCIVHNSNVSDAYFDLKMSKYFPFIF